jgi:hypothetical protein
VPPRRRLLLLASVLCAAVPVGFGVIRALTTREDLRYLWVAAAALLAAIAVTTLGRGGEAPASVSVGRAVAAVAGGTVAAAVTGVLVGATAGSGIAMVASAFGLFSGMSAVLYPRNDRSTSPSSENTSKR